MNRINSQREPATFVWIYWHGGAQGDELRWSIRSVLENFQGESTIFLVGEKPPWYTGNHLPVPRIPNQNNRNFKDALNKMCVATQAVELPESFVWMMDDIYLVKPLTLADLAIGRYRSLVSSDRIRAMSGKRNYWVQWKKRTFKALLDNGMTTYDYATHLPHVISRDDWQLMARVFDIPTRQFTWELIYGNLFYQTKKPIDQFYGQVRRQMSAEQIQNFADRYCIINNTQGGWSNGLRRFLMHRFPIQSSYESDENPSRPTSLKIAEVCDYLWQKPERIDQVLEMIK